MRILSLFPPLGQSIGLQYQLEGNFHMLPMKIYPTFTPNHTYKKVSTTCLVILLTIVGVVYKSAEPFAI
jgi:hypothetical protein